MTVPRIQSFAALLLAVLAAHAACAAESYDNCTGFVDALPALIDSQGTWCLRRNLSTTLASGNAINIDANNVTLDCNGFKLGGLAAGPESTATGIYAYGQSNVTVRRCNVRGFYLGINLLQGNHYLVEDNLVELNIIGGIGALGSDNLVRRNRVFDTAFPGAIRANGDVVDNTVAGVNTGRHPALAYAINVEGAPGAQVSGNIVRGILVADGSLSHGIRVLNSPGATAAGNHVVADASGSDMDTGIFVSGASPASFCVGNTIAGFTATVVGCTAAGNASH